MLLFWIIIFSLIGSVGSLIGGLFLIWKESWTQIPEIHHKSHPGRGFSHIILLGIGIGVIALLRNLD